MASEDQTKPANLAASESLGVGWHHYASSSNRALPGAAEGAAEEAKNPRPQDVLLPRAACHSAECVCVCVFLLTSHAPPPQLNAAVGIHTGGLGHDLQPDFCTQTLTASPPRYNAVKAGDFKITEKLLAEGGDPNAPVGKKGITAMHRVASTGNRKLALLLESQGGKRVSAADATTVINAIPVSCASRCPQSARPPHTRTQLSLKPPALRKSTHKDLDWVCSTAVPSLTVPCCSFPMTRLMQPWTRNTCSTSGTR